MGEMTFSRLQQEVGEWSARNFGSDVIALPHSVKYLLRMQANLGTIAHAVLKRAQGIRNAEGHALNIEVALDDLRQNSRLFGLSADIPYNGDKAVHMSSFLGMIEELGEFCEARTEEERDDAIADLCVFLADHCYRNKKDLGENVSKTWDKVKQRDWTKNKDTAHLEA